MGWEYTDGKPQLYSKLSKSNSAPSPATNPSYWTWAMGTVWYSDGDFEEEGVKYINDTGKQMKIGSVSIKTCSCHSGGQAYWAWGGQIPASDACVGWGGRYYCYVMVSNDGGSTFQTSARGYHDVPSINSSNMNSPGYDATHTASFGNPPYTGYSGLNLHEYVIPDCPTIEPGGVAFVQFGIASLTDSAGNKVEWANTTTSQRRKTVIRFMLNPAEMEVEFEDETPPYVWKYFDTKIENRYPGRLVAQCAASYLRAARIYERNNQHEVRDFDPDAPNGDKWLFCYSTTNLFSGTSKASNHRITDPVGRCKLDCSGFVGLCLRGIDFEHSIFNSPYYDEETGRSVAHYYGNGSLDYEKSSSSARSAGCSNYYDFNEMRWKGAGTYGWEFPEFDTFIESHPHEQPHDYPDYNNIGLTIDGEDYPYRTLRYAASQAEYFYNHGEILFDNKKQTMVWTEPTQDDPGYFTLNGVPVREILQPGDLIFWSKSSASEEVKKRFRSVSHVGICAERQGRYYHCTNYLKQVTFLGDGTRVKFELPDAPDSISRVNVDGVPLIRDLEYSYSPKHGLLTLSEPPALNSSIVVGYDHAFADDGPDAPYKNGGVFYANIDTVNRMNEVSLIIRPPYRQRCKNRQPIEQNLYSYPPTWSVGYKSVWTYDTGETLNRQIIADDESLTFDGLDCIVFNGRTPSGEFDRDIRNAMFSLRAGDEEKGTHYIKLYPGRYRAQLNKISGSLHLSGSATEYTGVQFALHVRKVNEDGTKSEITPMDPSIMAAVHPNFSKPRIQFEVPVGTEMEVALTMYVAVTEGGSSMVFENLKFQPKLVLEEAYPDENDIMPGWHLIKPVYIYQEDTWKNIEEKV